MVALAKIIDSRIRTPGPIDTLDPMDTFGPSYGRVAFVLFDPKIRFILNGLQFYG